MQHATSGVREREPFDRVRNTAQLQAIKRRAGAVGSARIGSRQHHVAKLLVLGVVGDGEEQVQPLALMLMVAMRREHLVGEQLLDSVVESGIALDAGR